MTEENAELSKSEISIPERNFSRNVSISRRSVSISRRSVSGKKVHGLLCPLCIQGYCQEPEEMVPTILSYELPVNI